jgi:hypothetical protein
MTRLASSLILLWLAFAAAVSVHAQETILHLRNGDRLTGKIVSEQDGRLTLDTVFQKGVIVPLTLIEKREAVPAPTPPAPPAPTPPPPAPVPQPAPPAPEQPKPSFWSQWHGEIQMGVDFLRSQRDVDMMHGRARATYIRNRLRQSLDYQAAYGKTDGVLSANRMDGASKTDWDISPKVFIYNLGAAGYDEIRRIDLTYEAGPGVGWRLMQETNFVLNTETGFNYSRTEFTLAPRREETNWRLAEDLTWKVNSKVLLEQKAAFTPRVDDFSAYRLRFEGTLKFFVLQNLSLNLSVIDLYDTRPAPGISRNDLQIRSSLGVKF